MVHCLFEQSGTFKNSFKELGFKAVDYDIADDFHQTDFKLDLFHEIRNNFLSCTETCFDQMKPDDLIFAFFPCTFFSDNSNMLIQGIHSSLLKKPSWFKVEVSMDRHRMLSEFYEVFCQFVIQCLIDHRKVIIENPYHAAHYLTRYFPIKPTIIDMDRRRLGDNFKKPTQYWFLNCQPCLNHAIFDEPIIVADHLKNVQKISGFERSLISPHYARRFIKTYILDNPTISLEVI